MKKRGSNRKYAFMLVYLLTFVFLLNYADAQTCASGLTCTLPDSRVTQCCRKATLTQLSTGIKLFDALEYNNIPPFASLQAIAAPGFYNLEIRICDNLRGCAVPASQTITVNLCLLGYDFDTVRKGCKKITGECQENQPACSPTLFNPACVTRNDPTKVCCDKSVRGWDYNYVDSIVPYSSPTPGVTICGKNYNCGVLDGVCPSTYGANCGAICDNNCGYCPPPPPPPCPSPPGNVPCGCDNVGSTDCSGNCMFNGAPFGDCGGGGGGGGPVVPGCVCSDSTVETGVTPCGNCGLPKRICDGCNYGAWFCAGQGPCSSGSTQCVNNRHQTCSAGCAWANDGIDADGDGVDQQCEDTSCDNSGGVCDVAVAGKCIAKTATETLCADNLDNDCDGLTDCNDPNCAGSIQGTVTNENAQSVSSAVVGAKQGSTTVGSASTNPLGVYSIGSINCGAYNLIASHADYFPGTKSGVVVPPTTTITENFVLLLGTSCEEDCTFVYDELVHASCDGHNGCNFCDSISKSVCDLSKPGWIRDYDATNYVVCGEGCPQPRTQIKASVSCSKGTLAKTVSIVDYNDKPANLVVVTCS